MTPKAIKYVDQEKQNIFSCKHENILKSMEFSEGDEQLCLLTVYFLDWIKMISVSNASRKLRMVVHLETETTHSVVNYIFLKNISFLGDKGNKDNNALSNCLYVYHKQQISDDIVAVQVMSDLCLMYMYERFVYQCINCKHGKV